MNNTFTLLKLNSTIVNNSARDEFKIEEFTRDEGMKTKETEDVYSPSDFVINRILDFSKSYEVLKSASAGMVELNLN